MHLEQIPARLAREVVEREHYLHRKPPVSFSFGLYEENELLGVCTYGSPAGLAVRKSACPTNEDWVIELNRLWVHDRLPRNTESWFVARTLHELPALIVVSYADTAQGHMGYIYRALNFKYAGWTDMGSKSVNYDYVYQDPDTGSITYSSDARPWNLKIPRKPKVRYWIATGNPTERRFLSKICAWPSLDWTEYPPPSIHLSLPDYRLLLLKDQP